MIRRVIGMIIKVILFLIIAIAGFGQAVHYLWNRLMPILFHLPAITFWQAVGLLALSWLLFGGWRFHHHFVVHLQNESRLQTLGSELAVQSHQG